MGSPLLPLSPLPAWCQHCDIGPWPPAAGARLLLVTGPGCLQGQHLHVPGLLVTLYGLWMVFRGSLCCGQPGPCILRFTSLTFAGGILGALFNALNYWLTMFRIR